MRVERFDRKKHLDSANILLMSRQMTETWTAVLPRFGFIAHKGKVPIAMGFIRKLEGNMGVLDSYITNYKFKYSERRHALTMVSTEIVKFSKEVLKLNGLIAFSDHPNIIQLAKDFKFTTHEKNVFQTLKF